MWKSHAGYLLSSFHRGRVRCLHLVHPQRWPSGGRAHTRIAGDEGTRHHPATEDTQIAVPDATRQRRGHTGHPLKSQCQPVSGRKVMEAFCHDRIVRACVRRSAISLQLSKAAKMEFGDVASACARGTIVAASILSPRHGRADHKTPAQTASWV